MECLTCGVFVCVRFVESIIQMTRNTNLIMILILPYIFQMILCGILCFVSSFECCRVEMRIFALREFFKRSVVLFSMKFCFHSDNLSFRGLCRELRMHLPYQIRISKDRSVHRLEYIIIVME